MSRVLAQHGSEWQRRGEIAPQPDDLHPRLPHVPGQPIIRRRLRAAREVEQAVWSMLTRNHLDGMEP